MSTRATVTYLLVCLSLVAFAGALRAKAPDGGLCRVQTIRKVLIAECGRKSKRFALAIYPNRDYYMGQWAGKPRGKGLMMTKMRDPKHKHHGMHRHDYGVWRNGKRLKVLTGFDMDSGCLENRCRPEMDLRMPNSGGIYLGDWKNMKMYGLGLQRVMLEDAEVDLLDILIGDFHRSKARGEVIFVDWSAATIFHGIWKDGRMVRILSRTKFREP